MAFRFSLATLLRYREALEQRELLALEKLQHEIALAEARIIDTQQKQRALEDRRQSGLREGMTAIQLQSELQDEATLQSHSNDLKRQKQELFSKRERRMATFNEAREAREVVEKMRERKLSEYTREQSKAEQSVLDDLFLAWQKRDR